VTRLFSRQNFSRISCFLALFLVSFPLVAAASNVGQLTPSPWTVSFGVVPTGTTQSRTDTITNSGSLNVTIQKVSVVGKGFATGTWNLPLTLSPGQSIKATVTFTSTSTGRQRGDLYLTWTSGGAQRVLDVSLQARASGSSSGQLTSNPGSMSFGNVAVGTSKSWAGTLANSASYAVTLSQAQATGTGFKVGGLTLPLTLNPGQSASYTISFAPQSSGTFSGNLAITSNAPNAALNVPLSGTGVVGGQIAATPSSLSFGSVAMGSSKNMSETLSNSGTAALTISQVSPSGAGFSFSGINPPVTLSPGQNFTFTVTYKPTSSGTANGTLSVGSNAANSSLSVPLSGSGGTAAAGQLSVSPSSINFGSVTTGSSQSQTATLSASNGSVSISSASITGTEFSVSGISFPLTLASGQSASFKVTFKPQSSGATSATLAFASNASNGSVSEALSGSGTPAVQHSVALNWNASTSGSVVGYNVYRSGQSGGPYAKINSTVIPSTTDTDGNVQSGSTYYYVVTAVDSSGRESVFSNQVQAVIP
jgi:hypothetical protein